jgi:hypothetical protein
MKTCEHCQKEFKPKRRHARFCSDKCQAAAYRKNLITYKRPVKKQRCLSRPIRCAKTGTVPAGQNPVSGPPAPFPGHKPIAFADLMKEWTTAPVASGSDAAKAEACLKAVRKTMEAHR